MVKKSMQKQMEKGYLNEIKALSAFNAGYEGQVGLNHIKCGLGLCDPF